MIYVVKHNDDMYIPLMKNYKIINVGKLYEDNGRDNINYLNPYINETTALYDLWKNYNDEIIGMIHYRRLFITNEYNALSFNIAKEILKQVDLITTPIHDLGEYTIYSHLKYSLKITDPCTIAVFEKYINKLGKIDPKIVTYFYTRHGFIAKNMFVSKKEIIDQYCKWLFSFIIELTEEFIEKDIKNAKGQERIIGHLVERLFSYWIEEVYDKKDRIGVLLYLTFLDDM